MGERHHIELYVSYDGNSKQSGGGFHKYIWAATSWRGCSEKKKTFIVGNPRSQSAFDTGLVEMLDFNWLISRGPDDHDTSSMYFLNAFLTPSRPIRSQLALKFLPWTAIRLWCSVSQSCGPCWLYWIQCFKSLWTMLTVGLLDSHRRATDSSETLCHTEYYFIYSRTPLIRPPSESHWFGRIRGMVAREGFSYAALLQQRHTKYGRIRGMVVGEGGRSTGVLLYYFHV